LVAALAAIPASPSTFETIFDRHRRSLREVRVSAILTDRHRGVAVPLEY
jgi:hypothetical protein